jgi:hypothetical protein
VNLPNATIQRLQFLCRVTERESKHLQQTCLRLFVPAFSVDWVRKLDAEPELGERVDAFVSRFGRLQDTLGDKLLPAMLAAHGERVATVADNLDKAERLGWVSSADNWFAMRALRNQMVHEYVEDSLVLFSALQAGYGYLPDLQFALRAMHSQARQRGWLL